MPGESLLPLSGIRVLDFSHVIAGPFTTYQLALLGADVVRVERIDGDDFVRTHGGTQEMKALGLGASFLSQNANKRSIALDLKTDKGVEIALSLAERADVVMENFRPGVIDRLGLGFDSVSALKPNIVYCSLSGYGPTGPMATAPAYDHIVQGNSGMMAMTGTPESGPMRVGFPIVDYIAGQTAVIAIMSALAQRDRNGAKAQHLNVSMLDSLVSLMGAYAVDHETTGKLRGLSGNEAFSNSPFSGRFDTADGYIVVTANTMPQARRLCSAVGSEELAQILASLGADGSYSLEQTDTIQSTLRATFGSDTAAVWEERLTAAGVPAAAVRSLAQTLELPQLQGSGLMKDLPVPELDMRVQVPGLPFQADGWETSALAAAPTLGRDTDQVLSELGLDESAITALKDEKVVA